MATVTIFSPQGGSRTITFEGDPDPAVTSVEADRVLQKIKDLPPCPSCTFLFDASNSSQRLTFDKLKALKNQPAVRFQKEVPLTAEDFGAVTTFHATEGEPLPQDIVIQPRRGKIPQGSTWVVRHPDGYRLITSPGTGPVLFKYDGFANLLKGEGPFVYKIYYVPVGVAVRNSAPETGDRKSVV